ncbi:hypothetical protein IG631_11852 [Alternaria alternata]|nr:hypothetical protein IG631_11852 [Alternaria alternata]
MYAVERYGRARARAESLPPPFSAGPEFSPPKAFPSDRAATVGRVSGKGV